MKMEPIPEHIYDYPLPETYNETRKGFVDSGFMQQILAQEGIGLDGFTAPVSQFGPRPMNSSLAMVDLFSHPVFKKEIIASLEYDVPVISEVLELDFLLSHIEPHDEQHSFDYSRLRSFTLDPVKRDFHEGAETIGYMVGITQWEIFFANVLPETISGIVVTVVSDCGSVFTYAINGGTDDWAAMGDHHDSKFDDMAQQFKFFWKEHPTGESRHCHFDLFIYPSQDFVDEYITSKPLVYTGLVLAVFFAAGVAFYVYNTYIQNDKQHVMDKFARAETVVKSLFPDHVGDQLMQEVSASAGTPGGRADDKKHLAHTSAAAKNSLDGFLKGDSGTLTNFSQSNPIADYYEETTVLFADIVGFTSWSAAREPAQVFRLLETLYSSFDDSAERYGIFKVETIGDCYVAASGLPERRKDHFIAMARFAQVCMSKMYTVCHELQGELGHDTAQLSLRVGLHSGPGKFQANAQSNTVAVPSLSHVHSFLLSFH